MKPEELRIGNIVDLYGTNATIVLNDFISMHFDECHFGRFKPLKLTKEWFNYFGFYTYSKYQSILYIDYGKPNRLTFEIQKPYCMSKSHEFYSYIISKHYFKELNYVHELQNLFHAISGEDLKRKQI